MSTVTPDLASQWKALNPQQRDLALSRMTPEQKTKLATSLGFKSNENPGSSLGDWRDVYTRINPPQSDTFPHAVEDVFGNIGAAGLGAILRPVATAKGIGNFLWKATDPSEIVKGLHGEPNFWSEMAKQMALHPQESAEQMIGQTAVLGGLGESAIGKTGDAIKNVGSAPRAVRDLVGKISEENAAEQAKADAANVEAEAARKADLKKHFEKTSALKEEKLEAQKEVSRKEAAKYGVEKADEPLREDLTRLKEKEHAEASKDFDAVKEKLQHFPADMERLNEAWEEQARSFGEVGAKGSTGNLPPVLTKIGKIIERGDTLIYKDEQLLYTELGSELSKGTLPGSTYNAYDKMQDAIGEDMQRIADSQKMGPQLKAARIRWTNLKKTFYDPRSPVAKALKAKERGGTIKAFRGADRTGIEAVARYDPSLARRLASTRDALELGSTPVKAVPAKVLPKLAPKPPNLAAKTNTLADLMKPNFEMKKIGEKEIEAVKKTRVRNAANHIRHWGTYLGFVWPAIEAIRTTTRGVMPDMLTTGVSMIATPLAADAIANIIETPKMQWLLTRATPRDIAQIPEELRGDLPAIVKTAEQKGIGVSPAMKVAVLSTANLSQGKQRVGAALHPATELVHEDKEAKLPPQISRIADALHVQYKQAPEFTAPNHQEAIASVAGNSPNTISINDPKRFSMGPLQIKAHEIYHLWRNNLPGPMRAMAMPDNPSDPYNLSDLRELRAKGYTMATIPNEQGATIVQTWVARPEMRKELQPWIDDMGKIGMSIMQGTDPTQQGINVVPRTPLPPLSAYQ